MKTMLLSAALVLAGCGTANFQQFEGRTDRIIEGQGGTKEVIDGVEFWENGDPPRRYKVLGVSTIEDKDNPIGRQLIRGNMVSQVKKAGGDAGVIIGGYSQGRTSTLFIGSGGFVGAGSSAGDKQVRLLVVQYLDKPAAK